MNITERWDLVCIVSRNVSKMSADKSFHYPLSFQLLINQYDVSWWQYMRFSISTWLTDWNTAVWRYPAAFHLSIRAWQRKMATMCIWSIPVVPKPFSLKPPLPVSKTSQAPPTPTRINKKNKVINYKLLFAKINNSCRFLLLFSLL